MAHVIILDSINEDIFVCGLCKSVYNSLQVFMDHKKIECMKTGTQEHNKMSISTASVQTAAVVSTAICENRGMNQNVKPPTTANEQNVWGNDVSCLTCKKKFKLMKTLLTHMKTHNEKPYQCNICGRCFVQNSHLQRHITSHKMWPDGHNETTAKTTEVELLSYTCSYCNLILLNYPQYRSHLKSHWSFKKYKCIQGECMEFFDTVEHLLNHVSAVHNSPLYSCHICSSTFNSMEDIATHQYTHSNPKKHPSNKRKQHKCPQCDAVFRKSEKLSLHMLTENHTKVCIHCNKTFASDKRLRLHLQIHRTLKPFQCNICNSSFHMKKYLSSHMLKHGNRQFKCPVCKFMFKRQDMLHRHMKLHQPRKMLNCPFKDTLNCKKQFSRSDKLKSHIKSHMKHVSFNTAVKGKPAQVNSGMESQNSGGMESQNSGGMESQNSGGMESQNSGGMESQNSGGMESQNSGGMESQNSV